MTDTPKDGGPAFPSQPSMLRISDDGIPRPEGFEGMSLRDYFAGQALAGIIVICARDIFNGRTPAQHFAEQAYSVADAMLAAREREQATENAEGRGEL